MATIKLNKTVSKTEEVEMEITFPCYRKVKQKYTHDGISEIVCILSEKEVVGLYRCEKPFVLYPAFNSNKKIAEYFEDSFIEAAAEEFNELFKETMEHFAQLVGRCNADFLVNVDPLPVPTDLNIDVKERGIEPITVNMEGVVK